MTDTQVLIVLALVVPPFVLLVGLSNRQPAKGVIGTLTAISWCGYMVGIALVLRWIARAGT